MWIITLILFVFLLGIIVLVHEFGHFIWAKKFGVYIYEFSIGMGPIIYSHTGKKDGIKYNIRALPIGGFVSMAGEVYEDDEETKINGKKLAKDKFLCNKPIWQRIIVMAAGVTNNFILAIILLIITGFIWGNVVTTNKISMVEENSVFEKNGIVAGDTILKINGKKISSWEEAQTRLAFKSKDDTYTFTIKNKDGEIKDYKLKKDYVYDKDGNPIEENGEKVQRYGFSVEQKVEKGFFNSIKDAFLNFCNFIYTMLITLGNLVVGRLSIDNLSGPVGIYQVVGDNVTGLGFAYGVQNFIRLLSLLSINVGLINILPFPAFDGGHILFLIIEKIKGSPVNQNIENWCHTIGFILIMLLIIFVTINDIMKLF